MSGEIDGREIDAVTINADENPLVLVMEGGFHICLKPGRTRVTLRGNPTITIPCGCEPMRVRAPRTSFTVQAKRGCQ